MKRWTKDLRCPICGGCDRDERHKGKRCNGYLSSDGDYAHCQREEKAGSIEPHPKTGLFPHKLKGQCNCGETHGDAEPRTSEQHFVYRDETGTPLYRVVRTPDKRFYQQHPVGDRWEPKLNGARLVPYRLPELVSADPAKTVYIAEGEKCVEALRDRGLVATCNPMGAERWHQIADEAAKVLQGRHVVVLLDDDAAGRRHGGQVVAALQGVAASVRVVELYKSDSKRDVYNWFAEGHTADELAGIAAQADSHGRVTVDGLTVVHPSKEPASDEAPSDPWQQEIAKALGDVRNALGVKAATARAPLFKDATHLLNTMFLAVPWEIDRLITKGGITVAAGEPKAGIKTWLTTEGAIAKATGTKMCGEFKTDKGIAAIFFAEDQVQSVQNRVRALLKGADRDLEPGRLHLQPRGEFIDVLKDDDLAWVIASARRLGNLDLLVLDPLRDIHSGEEDKSDSMRDVMRRLRVLAELLTCTVWITHHTPKVTKDTSVRRPGQNLRGSSAIHGSIDSGLYIQPGEGDGTNVFKAQVTSQVKAGRSAGVFDLELTIVDDEHGAAESARWSYARADFKKGPAKADADDDRAFEFVRGLAMRGEVLTRTGLRGHDSRPIPEKRLVSALDRLLDSGRLLLEAGQVVCPGSRGSEGHAND